MHGSRIDCSVGLRAPRRDLTARRLVGRVDRRRPAPGATRQERKLSDSKARRFRAPHTAFPETVDRRRAARGAPGARLRATDGSRSTEGPGNHPRASLPPHGS